MVRKLTEVRVEQNGNSLKVFRYGKYIGSISKEVLANAIENTKR